MGTSDSTTGKPKKSAKEYGDMQQKQEETSQQGTPHGYKEHLL